MKIKRARKPKTEIDRQHLPSLSDNVTIEDLGQKNDTHKVSLGPDSKR